VIVEQLVELRLAGEIEVLGENLPQLLRVAFQSVIEGNGVRSAEGTVLFVASQDEIGERISAMLPISPYLTSCNFYLWGCVKDQVYQPPML
jgi:hypothetical protein